MIETEVVEISCNTPPEDKATAIEHSFNMIVKHLGGCRADVLKGALR